MASAEMTLMIKMTPSKETMSAILHLLNLWQDDNPDKMVALVPDHNAYVYEIIQRGNENDRR